MSKVLRLALVSHAATDATRTARFPDDESMNDLGRRELAKVSPMTAERVLIAPERRTRETAAVIAPSGEIDPELREIDYAGWRGREMTSRSPGELTQWLTDPASTPHGGESIVALVDRTRTWLAAQTVRSEGVLAITHPSVIRAAVLVTLDAPPESFWRIDIPPLSVTRLHHRGRWTLRQTGYDYPRSTP